MLRPHGTHVVAGATDATDTVLAIAVVTDDVAVVLICGLPFDGGQRGVAGSRTPHAASGLRRCPGRGWTKDEGVCDRNRAWRRYLLTERRQVREVGLTTQATQQPRAVHAVVWTCSGDGDTDRRRTHVGASGDREIGKRGERVCACEL